MTTEVHLYRRRIPVWWWTRKPTYFLFVMRELSSFFVAWYVAYLLLLVHAVSVGGTAYRHFLDQAGEPWAVALNSVAFVFLVLHTVTWFHLTPKALVLRLRGHTVPPVAIIASQYAGLVLVSALLAWAVLR